MVYFSNMNFVDVFLNAKMLNSPGSQRLFSEDRTIKDFESDKYLSTFYPESHTDF